MKSIYQVLNGFDAAQRNKGEFKLCPAPYLTWERRIHWLEAVL